MSTDLPHTPSDAGTESSFVRWPRHTTTVVAPKDASEIVAASGANYQIRLARLFVVPRPDQEPQHPGSGILEVCDFDGMPLEGPKGRITIAFSITDTEFIRYEWRFGLYVPANTIFFEQDGRRTLDLPTDDNPLIVPVPGVRARLAERYRCEVGSCRAVLAFAPNGDAVVIAVVGSRYTVLQNTVLAQDALDFWSAGWGRRVDSSESLQLETWGSVRSFSICLSSHLLTDNGSELDGGSLTQELVLTHSHDGGRTYKHLWHLRDSLLRSHPVIDWHQVRLKHTRNVRDRSMQVSLTLQEIQQELTVALQIRSQLLRVPVPTEDDAMRYLHAVEAAISGRDSLDRRRRLKGICERYLKLAPPNGRNAWYLYLASCDFDQNPQGLLELGVGLPRLIESSSGLKWQNSARKLWLQPI